MSDAGIQFRITGIHHRASVGGSVTDAPSGSAISGARVELTACPAAYRDWLALRALGYGAAWASMAERPDRQVSRADGAYRFLDLPPGEYEITTSSPGYVTEVATAAVPLGESTPGVVVINFSLEAPASPPAPRVSRPS